MIPAERVDCLTVSDVRWAELNSWALSLPPSLAHHCWTGEFDSCDCGTAGAHRQLQTGDLTLWELWFVLPTSTLLDNIECRNGSHHEENIPPLPRWCDQSVLVSDCLWVALIVSGFEQNECFYFADSRSLPLPLCVSRKNMQIICGTGRAFIQTLQLKHHSPNKPRGATLWWSQRDLFRQRDRTVHWGAQWPQVQSGEGAGHVWLLWQLPGWELHWGQIKIPGELQPARVQSVLPGLHVYLPVSIGLV